MAFKTSDVHIVNGVAGLSIDGHGFYSLADLTAAMVDSESTIDRSVILDGLKVLAGYEAKEAKEEEKAAAIREAEEERLKAQAAVIDPVMAALRPISEALIDGLPEEFLMQCDFRISFRTGRFSVELDAGIPEEDLKEYAEAINGQSIGFSYDGDGYGLKPSVSKAAGTRAAGKPILQDGLWEVKSSGFRFVVKGGRTLVDGEAVNGTDFLLTYTEERGNVDNPTRPFSHPAKVIAAVSRFVSDPLEDEANNEAA